MNNSKLSQVLGFSLVVVIALSACGRKKSPTQKESDLAALKGKWSTECNRSRITHLSLGDSDFTSQELRYAADGFCEDKVESTEYTGKFSLAHYRQNTADLNYIVRTYGNELQKTLFTESGINSANSLLENAKQRRQRAPSASESKEDKAKREKQLAAILKITPWIIGQAKTLTAEQVAVLAVLNEEANIGSSGSSPRRDVVSPSPVRSVVANPAPQNVRPVLPRSTRSYHLDGDTLILGEDVFTKNK